MIPTEVAKANGSYDKIVAELPGSIVSNTFPLLVRSKSLDCRPRNAVVLSSN